MSMFTEENLGQNAVFGENAFASGFGPNGRHNRVPSNSLNLTSYFPQELMISIGRSPNSTNTLDHSTWVDWIKIETNNYLASVAASYGLSETNLLIDSDSDGQSDLTVKLQQEVIQLMIQFKVLD